MSSDKLSIASWKPRINSENLSEAFSIPPGFSIFSPEVWGGDSLGSLSQSHRQPLGGVPASIC